MKLFTTQPHGAQSLTEMAGQADYTIGNKLFRLAEEPAHGKNSMLLTGEELDSLTAQWLRHRANVEPAPRKYLTRHTPGIRIIEETIFKGTPSEHIESSFELDDKSDPGYHITGEAWKLDVGAELNTLLRLANVSTPATAQVIRSIVERVATFEELQTEKP